MRPPTTPPPSPASGADKKAIALRVNGAVGLDNRELGLKQRVIRWAIAEDVRVFVVHWLAPGASINQYISR
jgi:hypothetical protein